MESDDENEEDEEVELDAEEADANESEVRIAIPPKSSISHKGPIGILFLYNLPAPCID